MQNYINGATLHKGARCGLCKLSVISFKEMPGALWLFIYHQDTLKTLNRSAKQVQDVIYFREKLTVFCRLSQDSSLFGAARNPEVTLKIFGAERAALFMYFPRLLEVI